MSSIEMHYRKIRPLDIDSLAKRYDATEEDIEHGYNPFHVTHIQAFNPLYTEFFVLNDANYDRVGLNHPFYMDGAKIQFDKQDQDLNNEKYHVKSSPLLDPIHYLVGKYDSEKSLLQTLPTITNTNECLPKFTNKQNASYVDGFFCYLSSKMKHSNNMLNAIDFYGSYLALQRIFKSTITDDVDYLHKSNYFMERVGKEFSISCIAQKSGKHFDDFTGIGSRTNKKRIVIEDELTFGEFDVVDIPLLGSESSIVPESDVDVTVSCEYEKSETDGSDESSGSSEEDLNYSSAEEDEESPEPEPESNCDADTDESSRSGENSDGYSSASSEDVESLEEDNEVYAYIKDFPVNLIFLEKCDGTLDRLFITNQINSEQGASCLMQIVMSLLVFQRAFHFTHNDLHTNNIMYVNTDIEWLYYKYNNQFYRVPTHGRIFKIIDFGRAIYRFKDRIYCSDSFAPKGDAHSQYNTEPYFNAKKPRIEPNMSFDLCRLGTSIYDFVIQDEDDARDEFQETIYRWCLDDNHKNIMYRRDGDERYPGFKLYKMIAKNVHAHTPSEQLKYPFFNQFLMESKDAAKLDESEVRRYGLNIDLVGKEYYA